LAAAALVAVSGLLADRFGRKRFLVLGTALPIVSYLVFAGTTVPGWLIAGSLLGGVGIANGAAGALSIASFDALLAEHTHPRQRTRAFTLASASYDLAFALGALGAGIPEWLRTTLPALADLQEYRLTFLPIIAVTAVATLLALPVRDAHAAARQGRGARGWLPRRSRAVIVGYALAIGLLGAGLGVAVQLLPLWFKLRFGADEALLGPWFAVSQVLSLSSLLVAPWLERRVGGGRGVLIAQALGGLSLALIAIAPSFEVAAGLFLVRNILMNLSWPLQQVTIMGAVAPEERASAIGFGFSVWGFTNALGPTLGGALLGGGYLVAPLLLGAVAYVMAGVMFGLGFPRQRAGASAELEPAGR
jgi:MFS family permease